MTSPRQTTQQGDLLTYLHKQTERHTIRAPKAEQASCSRKRQRGQRLGAGPVVQSQPGWNAGPLSKCSQAALWAAAARACSALPTSTTNTAPAVAAA